MESVQNIGKVNNIKLSFLGVGAGVNIYMDNIRVDYYKRNRDWRAGADLRHLILNIKLNFLDSQFLILKKFNSPNFFNFL